MRLNVLVVDDAAFIREILKSQIEKNGHNVIGEACDGEQAISYAKKLKPDLILMDLVLPKKNGIQAAEEILIENRNIKIIAVSTLDQDFLIKQAMEKGCVSFLAKPFDQESIRAIFSQVLNQGLEKTGVS